MHKTLRNLHQIALAENLHLFTYSVYWGENSQVLNMSRIETPISILNYPILPLALWGLCISEKI